MKLKCLNIECKYNTNNICQNIYLYVECFKIDNLFRDNFIKSYYNMEEINEN